MSEDAGDSPVETVRHQTIGEALREASAQLRAAGVETPERDARLLLSAAAGISVEQLIAAGAGELLGFHHRMVLEGMIRERIARKPVSRIVGEREFYGRAFRVTPATLDPRADSETLVSAAFEIVAREASWKGRPVRILDIGTGTGCLLVTLLAELPEAVGAGTDVSAEVLEVARENAARHGVGERARFQLRRSLEGVEGPFDLVISNPPYIRSADIAELEPEVREYDPRAALDGGEDGLHVYREISAELTRVAPDGWIAVEVGADQATDVARIFSPASSGEPRFWKDLGGHTRCVAVRTRG